MELHSQFRCLATSLLYWFTFISSFSGAAAGGHIQLLAGEHSVAFGSQIFPSGFGNRSNRYLKFEDKTFLYIRFSILPRDNTVLTVWLGLGMKQMMFWLKIPKVTPQT